MSKVYPAKYQMIKIALASNLFSHKIFHLSKIIPKSDPRKLRLKNQDRNQILKTYSYIEMTNKLTKFRI